MAKSGQNKGNKHAALPEGQPGHIQWTQSLSGDGLLKFVRCYGIDVSLPEKELRLVVAEKARELFEQAVENLE